MTNHIKNSNEQKRTITTLVLLVLINLLVYFLETTLVTDEMFYESMITQFDIGWASSKSASKTNKCD